MFKIVVRLANPAETIVIDDAAPESRSVNGHLIVTAHTLIQQRLYALEVFSRRPGFAEGHPLSLQAIDIEAIQLGVDPGNNLTPTYMGFDGTAHAKSYEAWPELTGCEKVFWVLHPTIGRKPVHGRIPPSGHWQIDGKRSLYLPFGQPGSELPMDRTQDAGLERLLGRRPGQFATGVHSGLDAFIGTWDGDLGSDAFVYKPGHCTAAQWWCVPHEIMPWWFNPPRGIYHLGATAGADGYGPTYMGGENGRYEGPLYMLTGSSDDMQLALVIARHIAAQGFQHLDPDGSFNDQHGAQRRSEKSRGDFTGDDKIPWLSHNWLADLIAVAAYSRDPVVFRAARDGLRKVLATNSFWQRKTGPRIVDRALGALQAGAAFTKDHYQSLYDACLDHMVVVINQMLQQVGDEHYVLDDGITSGSENALLGGAVHVWQCGGVYKRMVECSEMLTASGRTPPPEWHPKIIQFAEFMARNCILHQDTTFQYRSYSRTQPRGTTAYFGFPNYVDTMPTPLPIAYNYYGWADGLDGGKYAYPSWAGTNNSWHVSYLAYLGDHKPEYRPLVKDVLGTWMNRLSGDFRGVGGNISAKVCSSYMVGAADTGAILKISSW